MRIGISSFIVDQWIWLYATVAALLAYWCSRGSDGELVAALIGFGVLGVIYCVLLRRGARVRAMTGVVHFVVIEVAVIVALAIDPQLEEMGGILNYLIPAYVAVIVMAGWLASRMCKA